MTWSGIFVKRKTPLATGPLDSLYDSVTQNCRKPGGALGAVRDVYDAQRIFARLPQMQARP